MFGVTKDFIGKPAPPNYVAGLGRGATGFTTRSDIGPAREATDFPVDVKTKTEGDDDDDQYQDPENETGLFSAAPYEEDDEEADRVWDMIDKRMDERRKVRREAREKEELERYRRERPKISQQFADLKRQLTTMDETEWESIPDVGDLVGKNRKKSKVPERYTPLPDSVLVQARDQAQYQTSQTVEDTDNDTSGMMTDFKEIGQARDKVLGLKLDQVSNDSASGQTTIDPKGYITELNSVALKTATEIGDIKKARLLLNSVITTNPKHAPGWIAAARLEEAAGRPVQARSIIAKGCQQCNKNEDVWLESARLNTVENAKIILADAVRSIPQSVKIWLKAVNLETDTKNKKKVLRRALEFIPNSVKLWRTAINMEDNPEDAKVLLSRAVELIPLSVELWLALARLESYDNAKKILNKAVTAIPTSHEIWIAGARLQEEHGQTEMVEKMITAAVNKLTKLGANLSREQWIKEAEKGESNGSVLTCQAIIKVTIGLGLDEEDEEDLENIWMEDADNSKKNGSIETARAIYAHALKTFPGQKSIWQQAALLEKSHGTPESLEVLLKRAVKYCPQAEVLWLMGAKERWLAGDVDGARMILREAFEANPNSEQIWLAAVKVESENQEYERARILLENARKQSGTERVWMKSAMLERQMENYNECIKILEEGLTLYPTYDKLWMIKGQVENKSLNDPTKARETYNKSVKLCSKSVPLWIQLARLEEQMGMVTKARNTLEKARFANPKTAELWVEAIRIENRANNNSTAAKSIAAKALQECPTSGAIWMEAIFMEPRPQRKARSVDALKKCEHDPIIVSTVARLFWNDRKIEKARNWFLKAVQIDPDQGDSFAWWYKFELQHGMEEQKQEVIKRCIKAEPHHGEHWQEVAKDIKNIGKRTEEILTLCAASLD